VSARRAGGAARGWPRARPGPAVEIAFRDDVAWITLRRPAHGNRLDAELLAGLVEACEAAEDADAARVVVLRARGPAFSAGLPRGRRWPDPAWPDGLGALAAVTKPVIAALQGEALGWGLALALACDIRIASTAAVLGVPELGRGWVPGGGVAPRLARMIGVARTLDMVLLGRRLPARTAAEWGLVSVVVPPARLEATVAQAALGLAARGPLALRLAKEAVVKALDLPLADGIRLEEDLYVLLQTTEDRGEGVRAFLGRRKPRFSGR
jgi:enoyl-CoA hydratase